MLLCPIKSEVCCGGSLRKSEMNDAVRSSAAGTAHRLSEFYFAFEGFAEETSSAFSFLLMIRFVSWDVII